MWNLDVFKAKRALARFAVKVYVTVGVVTCAAVGAQFVIEYAASVFKRVNHVVFKEE